MVFLFTRPWFSGSFPPGIERACGKRCNGSARHPLPHRPSLSLTVSLSLYICARLSVSPHSLRRTWHYQGSTASYPGLGKLAQLEDIVLVVPDYRIAAFGFLAHPCLELDDPRGVSGNYGLLDQQLALRWVQDNVAHFGGDPARVTVLGQSSGGTSILGLLASPHSAGLFHSAVSLSASPNVTMGLRQAYAQFDTAIRTTTQCGQGTAGASLREMAACLRALPAAEVAAMLPTATFDVSPNLPASTRGQGYPGLIIVDGVTVVAEPEVALARGLVDVPLVLQTELAEMDTYENNATVNAMKNQAYADFFAGALTKGGWLRPAIAGLLDVYAEERNTSTELAYQMFIADYSFYCGSVELASQRAAQQQQQRNGWFKMFISFISLPSPRALTSSFMVMGADVRGSERDRIDGHS